MIKSFLFTFFFSSFLILSFGCGSDGGSGGGSTNAALSGSCGEMVENFSCSQSSRIQLDYFSNAQDCQDFCTDNGADCCSWNTTEGGACKAGAGGVPVERTDVRIYAVSCT